MATAAHQSPHGVPDRVMAVLLAGGQGSRLHELTTDECKPALSFGGAYRIVDFTMANVVRSGISRLIVATQYKPDTLHRHLLRHWSGAFAPGHLSLREGPVVTPKGYLGTADAVAANISLIDAAGVEDVLILAGDHIYAMDYALMIAAHRANGAVATIATTTVPLAEASAFGVLSATHGGQIKHFVEKPSRPTPVAPGADCAHVSLGIYVFRWEWLREILLADASSGTSDHDFGHDILPAAVQAGGAFYYALPGVDGHRPYWRDVGTLDAYRRAQLDFASGHLPVPWPDAPASLPRQLATPLSAVKLGTEYVLGGQCTTSAGCRTVLDQSVVLPGSCVLPGAHLSCVIVAPRTVVPAGLVVGHDAKTDARWFRRTEDGTILVTAAMLAARQSALRGHTAPRETSTTHRARTA